MANIYYLCILVTCGVFVDGNKVISGLYCKDPDTGKLYELNSTWPSITFCGNYTCKLSKKNITNTEYAPMTNINITKSMMNDLKYNKTDKKFDPSMINKFKNISVNLVDILNLKKSVNDEVTENDKIEKDMTFSPSELSTTVNNTKEIDKNDGYLTDEEIKTITNILHTVKKSDLEAIVDIYNLAQEIYNEIDISKNTHNNALSQSNSYIRNNVNKDIKKTSYWYNSKNFIVSNNIKSKETIEHTVLKPYIPYTYLKAPLSPKDFRILPYYYPISDFQRMSTYRNTKPTTENVNKITPCNKQKINTTTISENIQSAKTKTSHNQKMQMMLPYPFSNINRYNQNAYTASFYYNNYPWAQLTIYNKKKNYIDPYLGAFFPEAYITHPTNIKTVTNKEAQYNKKENASITKKIDARDETQKLPKWQTEPLSPKVIEEVKAKLDKKKFINLFPRKNVKLEKVGKVVKLDELRQKRQVGLIEEENPDTYEVQLQKIECITGTEPGYFSYGNLTEPYPACCPHKINN